MKKSSLIVCGLVVLALATFANAHSWIACADYTGSAGDYNANACRGYARNWFAQIQYAGPTFGADTGFNYQATESAPCKNTKFNPVSAAYNQQYPAAVYKAGQKVTLAWPSKNHVAATCTNQWIPDTELDILMVGPNLASDPTLSGFKKNLVANLSGHVNGQMDFKGFQNCPNFCSNMDKALCTGSFTVPNVAPGNYTFMWYWVFNAGSDPYTTCWDAVIQ